MLKVLQRATNLQWSLRPMSMTSRLMGEDVSVPDPDKNGEAPKTFNVLFEFLDKKETFGSEELRPKERPGRSWSLDELRLKSNQDLHKLWYVLLKERNVLLTMRAAHEKRGLYYQNPERLDRIKESMENLEEIVHERNDAVLRLETGDSASPRLRRVTSPVGFTYEKPVEEHLEPFEVSNSKEYEIPDLSHEQRLTQKLWHEKQEMKRRIKEYDEYWKQEWDDDKEKFRRGLRVHYKHVDHLPENVARKRAEEREQTIERYF
ncbi:unnamed protein product [Bursaphelenchus xylophilus]|uniref:Large ribosomal subunit protein uL29m n=1 Tax=Bursaphelenchus xylophilus TaxID=6326 RepID=A0A1I7RPZ5_BURXY|nr:unnamed protein product [Bursaphelenchus xylophilus]CAG9096879.1 unnamed protein product [Bursaphelenchus xylophilus]